MSDQLDLVARAEHLSRSEQWSPAGAAWQAVVDVNPVNGAFWDRLAQARFATGDHAGALSADERADAFGAWPAAFPGETLYRTACCHARLGDAGKALDALAESVRQGLRDPERAGTDPDLAVLRAEPRFRELVHGPAVAELSRVDGWRTDLVTLRALIERRVPFRDVLDAGFDAAVDALDRAIPELDDVRVVVGMWRLVRMLGDGHAYLDTAGAFPDWERYLPMSFYLFDEGLFITETRPLYGQLLGSEVLAFDGRPVSDVVEALDPVLSRDNEYGPRGTVPVWLRRPIFLHAVGAADDPGRVTLTVRSAGGGVVDVPVGAEASVRPLRSSRLPRDQASAYLRDVDNPYWFEYLPGENLVYFQFNSIADKPDETLAAFYRRMFGAVDAHNAALVIDLRWNGGGNTFLAQPLVHEVIRRDGLRAFVIVGRGTYSAAQNTATLLDRHTRAVFVGEPSGSSPNFVGETVPVRLPWSGVRANVSDLYWQTSWPFDRRTAIAPDIYAPPTFAAYQAGRDPAMDAILTHLNGH